MTVRVRTAAHLERLLNEIVRTAVSDVVKGSESDSEKQYQANLGQRIDATVPHAPEKEESGKDEADIDSLFKGGGEEPEPEPETSLKDDPDGGEDHAELTPEDITVDAVIDKLNIIRSGRSLKDAEVSEQMDEYIRGLDDAQRVALYGFMKSIGQIVAADVSGDAVKEPEDEPYDVKMKRVHGLEQKRKADDKRSDFARAEMEKRLSRTEEREPESTEEPRPRRRTPEDRTPPVRVGGRR